MEANLHDIDDQTRFWDIKIDKDGRITSMVEQNICPNCNVKIPLKNWKACPNCGFEVVK
jgi:rRNA maturation endonuclease Nob1